MERLDPKSSAPNVPSVPNLPPLRSFRDSGRSPGSPVRGCPSANAPASSSAIVSSRRPRYPARSPDTGKRM